jgi:flagellar biosynthetic protein FliQ
VELSEALDLAREALLLTLIVSAPVLGAGVIVGLVISLIQAVTQLQDQTISIVPKIVAMVLIAILVFPWLVQRVLDYSANQFALG